jgi:hypothetical protein
MKQDLSYLLPFLFLYVAPALIVFGVLKVDWCSKHVNRFCDVHKNFFNNNGQFWSMIIILVAILSFLFRDIAIPNQVLFSNDGPLGWRQAEQAKAGGTWEALQSRWLDLNWLGEKGMTDQPTASLVLYLLCMNPIFQIVAVVILIIICPTILFKSKNKKILKHNKYHDNKKTNKTTPPLSV